MNAPPSTTPPPSAPTCTPPVTHANSSPSQPFIRFYFWHEAVTHRLHISSCTWEQPAINSVDAVLVLSAPPVFFLPFLSWSCVSRARNPLPSFPRAAGCPAEGNFFIRLLFFIISGLSIYSETHWSVFRSSSTIIGPSTCSAVDRYKYIVKGAKTESCEYVTAGVVAVLHSIHTF